MGKEKNFAVVYRGALKESILLVEVGIYGSIHPLV
jgi:hypothetical protein